MRIPVTFQLTLCALLLAAFCGFSPLPTIVIVLGVGIVIVGQWDRNRLIGIVGYALAMAAVLVFTDISSITSLWMIAAAGAMFMLPSSVLIWHVLTSGSEKDARAKAQLKGYTAAAGFGLMTLLSVPIVGIAMGSPLLGTDVGETTQIMIISFVSAILAALFLGVERKK